MLKAVPVLLAAGFALSACPGGGKPVPPLPCVLNRVFAGRPSRKRDRRPLKAGVESVKVLPEYRTMPFTEKQRKMFNAASHDAGVAEKFHMGDGEASDLASEANRLKKEGKERDPVGKAGRPTGLPFIDLAPLFGPRA